VIEERTEGLLQLKIIDNISGQSHYLPFDEPTYTAYVGINLDFDTEVLRYGYTSLTKPSSTYEYNMKTHETKLLKQQEVLGGILILKIIFLKEFGQIPETEKQKFRFL
jgi:oligopeptidase B